MSQEARNHVVTYITHVASLPALIAVHPSVPAKSVKELIAQVRAGRLRALGVTTAQRTAAAPDIPTIAEGGLPGFDSVQWYGLFAPAHTPREIVERLNKETVAMLQTNQVRERLAADGAEIVGSTPEAFAAFYQAELAKWSKVVKAAGIPPE